jgi:hypothetical protein
MGGKSEKFKEVELKRVGNDNLPDRKVEEGS